MIFHCRRKDQEWYERWTRWFAWYPVRLTSTLCVWLEVVERKDGSKPTSDYISWIYRRPTKAK